MKQVTLALAAWAGVGLLATGCTSSGTGGEEDGASSSVTLSASPYVVEEDEGRYFSIEELGFGDSGHVALKNFTDSEAGLGGLYLCEPPQCVELPDVEVGPEETAIVAMGDGEQFDSVVLADAPIELDPGSGEIGLYASEVTDSTSDIRDYLEWGSTPHEGTATAIEAGLWVEGSYLNSSPSAVRIFQTPERWDWE